LLLLNNFVILYAIEGVTALKLYQ